MECWLGLFMSKKGRASYHFKDAFIIFKILTSSSIFLTNGQLLLSTKFIFLFSVYFVCLFLEVGGSCLEGVLAWDF